MAGVVPCNAPDSRQETTVTETWFRNPHNYIRELAEVGVTRVTWDRGLLQKRRIDPIKHADTYFAGREWRIMLIGQQGSAEYRSGQGADPVAVYPTWDAKEDPLELLEEMLAYPVGEIKEVTEDKSIEIDARPVFGQEHRVVVINLPSMSQMGGKRLVRELVTLQDEYPEAVLQIHGLYSWRINFGMGFRAVDVDPRTNAGKGKVTLPSGKEVVAERTVSMSQWVTMLGMNPVDLTREPRNRCIYNIKSALWAADNFMENIIFAAQGQRHQTYVPDTTSKTASPVVSKRGKPFSRPSIKFMPNDKINCDTCSVQNSCKFYRQGSVCSVPGSEPAELAKYFKTRDADMIIDGLGTLMSLQARRLDQGVRDENMYGELDPEVTKIANQLFTNGAKLAKLVDPQRFASANVQVNVGGTAAAQQVSTPNQIMGSIVRELEARGIPRSEITPDMVQGLLAEMAGGGRAPAAIEGEVLGRDDS
jgi:hypothetical protein